MRRKLYLQAIFHLLIIMLLAGCSPSHSLQNTADSTRPVFLQPPFLKNKKFLVSQGFYGEKTHQDEFNAYAVDLAMPANEPVCAAMAGVVDQYQDVDKAMLEDPRLRQGNFVRIKHRNKTWGLYAHLSPNSITVTTGQQIKQGQCFAKAGNTGYSTAPHLHFALLKKIQNRFISVPFHFIQANGQTAVPKYLQWVSN